MALVAVKPPVDLFIIQNQRVPMTLRIQKHTTLITFKRYQDAELISEALETQYMVQKQWPDLTSEDFSVFRYPIGSGPPTILDIVPQEYDRLKDICTMWNLNMCVIEEIKQKKSSLNFTGDILSFTAPVEYYRGIYEVIYDTD